MLEAKALHKSYNDLHVLKGIDISIQKAEVVSIVGASGAGKSTLLQILGTLDVPDAGVLSIAGRQVNGLSGKEIAKFRNEFLGFIFQFHNLFPEFTALENICMPAFIKKDRDAKRKAEKLLDRMGLLNRSSHKPSELSGGEQQRISVARALINNPSVVFADEPSGNLDSNTADDLHQLFFQLRDELEQTFVIVTHNKGLAKMADRSVVIKDGAVLAK